MKPMSLRLLVRALQQQGCEKIRETGKHSMWRCPCGQHSAPVPRHTEISAGVVKDVQQKMACLPEGWLQ